MESYLKTDVIASSGKRFYWCTWFRDINHRPSEWERVYYSILIISQFFFWYDTYIDSLCQKTSTKWEC